MAAFDSASNSSEETLAFDLESACLAYTQYEHRDALSSILEYWKSGLSLREEDLLSPLLHHAVSRGYSSDVQAMLDAGVSPLLPSQNPPQDFNEEYNRECDTEYVMAAYIPLHTAAQYGQRDIARLLWDQGGLEYRVKVVSPYGTYLNPQHVSSIEVAAKYGHATLVEDFLEWAPWMKEELGRALIAAAENWYDDVIALLLERAAVLAPTDVRIHQSNPKRNTFLSRQRPDDEKFSAETIKAALAATLEKSSCEDDAVARQYTTVCHLVDAIGDAWDGSIGFSSDPMLLSAISPRRPGSPHLGALRALLDKGADPNVQGADGRMPLHLSVNIATTEALLLHGASPELADHEGETPMHTIAKNGTLEQLKLYLDYCHDPDVALRQFTVHGESLLHYAAAGKDIDVVQFLISRGLDVNAVTNNGWTPLVCALMPTSDREVSDTAKIANLLLQHGALAETVTAESWTPMHALASWPWPGDMDTTQGLVVTLVLELIQQGAVLDARPPVLRGKHMTMWTVRDMWGARMQKLAEMEAAKGNEEVREDDTTAHMWAFRVGSMGVFEAIMDHFRSAESSS